MTTIVTPKPSPFLEMEDLCLRYELKDLEEMLKHVFSASEKMLNSDRIFPMTDDQRLIGFMREVAHEELYESLFSKRFRYTNSLIASVTKSLKSCLMVSNENTLDLIKNDLLSENKRTWLETLYRSYLQPLSYFEALLRDEKK